jgi:hypothetical protein
MSTNLNSQNNPNIERALALCRGSFQKELVLGKHSLGSKTWTRKMQRYAGNYERSVESLIRRLEWHKVPFEIVYGPRGGWYSAYLHFPEN